VNLKKHGESIKLQHKDVTMVVWHDNWGVLLLSANSDPRTDGLVMKKKWQRERRQNSIFQSCGEIHPKHGGSLTFWIRREKLWCWPPIRMIKISFSLHRKFICC
jgi:hypothetical protein